MEGYIFDLCELHALILEIMNAPLIIPNDSTLEIGFDLNKNDHFLSAYEIALNNSKIPARKKYVFKAWDDEVTIFPIREIYGNKLDDDPGIEDTEEEETPEFIEPEEKDDWEGNVPEEFDEEDDLDNPLTDLENEEEDI